MYYNILYFFYITNVIGDEKVKDIIRQIRQYTKLSQIDMARKIVWTFCWSWLWYKSLVIAFMKGDLTKYLDSTYNRMQWAGEEYILEELIDTFKDKLKLKHKKFSKDTLYWMGYVYHYFHYYTNEESKIIYKQAPFATMMINYFMFHTMDVEMAIDDLKEIYRQKNK